MQQIAEKFIIFNRFPKSRQFRCKTPHLGVILVRCQGEFLSVIEFASQVLCLSAGGSFEHSSNGSPGLGSGGDVKQMGKDLRRQGVEEETENLLVSGHPLYVCRIGNFGLVLL
jgi:hypothetical protein